MYGAREHSINQDVTGNTSHVQGHRLVDEATGHGMVKHSHGGGHKGAWDVT